MSRPNSYDVTDWADGDPHEDIGAVINSILTDIKRRQADRDIRNGGRPGAVIRIPPGDYRLATQVVIDISFLRIEGDGHGFTSSSIRFNTPAEELAHWHEFWPGGSRVMVDLAPLSGEDSSGAAFLVSRAGNPRISSVEFANFCIDGLHFTGKEGNPENSYINGKTGIHVASANDSFRITCMGLIYLEHGIMAHHADAMAIDNNFVAECGNCIELRGMGQACRVSNNLIGAGYRGHSIFAENYGGILVAANNVFPRGASSLHLSGVVRSSVTGNRFHSFYPGMLILSDNSAENLISANHFLRDAEPWAPMFDQHNGRDDLFGLLRIEGSNNSLLANHISLSIDAQDIKPAGARPVVINLVAGRGNYIANNHIVATSEAASSFDAPSSACFEAQVGALLSTQNRDPLEVTAVRVAEASTQNTVLDSAYETEVDMDRARNAFRPTPVPGQ